jgi:hypothetical protein
MPGRLNGGDHCRIFFGMMANNNGHRAFGRKDIGNPGANAPGPARDKYNLAAQLEVHDMNPVPGQMR